MTCQELTGFLDQYLDGSLPPGMRAEFERHLSLCKACVDFLDGYRLAADLGRKALGDPKDPVPDRVPPELVKAVLESVRRKTR